MKERFANIREDKLLEFCQDSAALLASALCLCKAKVRGECAEDHAEVLLPRVGRMAVLLDVLQLRYGDASGGAYGSRGRKKACAQPVKVRAQTIWKYGTDPCDYSIAHGSFFSNTFSWRMNI